jgi:hypothetical protein
VYFKRVRNVTRMGEKRNAKKIWAGKSEGRFLRKQM